MYLFMIFAETCGHCVNFKKTQLDSTLTEFKKNGKIRPVVITLSTMGDPLPNQVEGINVPLNLRELVAGYPTFMLISQDEINSRKVVNPIAYGVSFEGTRPTPVPVAPATKTSLLEWATNNLTTKLTPRPVPNEIPPVPPGTQYLPTEYSCRYKIVPRR